MSIVKGMRAWWQAKTGEEETPLDGFAPVWVISMLVHLVLMFILAFTEIGTPPKAQLVTMLSPTLEEEEELFELTEDFAVSELPAEDIGANSFEVADMARSEAPVVAEVSVVPTPELHMAEDAQFKLDTTVLDPAGLHQSDNVPVAGSVGEGTTGATGAIDRITQEIVQSLEERKTLVVWLFDQSGSLNRQRSEINRRFDRIYEELGVIEASGNPAFAKHEDKPLLTSVVAFGQTVKLMTKEPTDVLAEIKHAVDDIEQDNTGIEQVFTAVYQSADAYKKFRVPQAGKSEPERNVLLVVFTDERGNDVTGLEPTVKICRRYAMPVFVVGVPAPFGREETHVKVIDPNPEYDQRPQWGRVDQGPESCYPERIKLAFDIEKEQTNPIDSGFGPFALTRLTYQTGGMYFAVHPNRNVNRAVSRREVAEYSSYLEHFFDPNVMRRYRPDYVSDDEYKRRVASNKARMALHAAAQKSWLTPLDEPRTRFEKRDEAAFANLLSEAQKSAAKLGPVTWQMYQTLKDGESGRKLEATPRWQAGYDLAMGRVMAVLVRTDGYNKMLAQAKRGLKFKDPKNNTWVLEPSDSVSVGSDVETMSNKAKMYLQRVVDEHPDTPWALLAKQELDNKLGWEWKEDYTKPPAARGGGGNNNPRPARDDEAMKLKRGKPKRALPPL